MAYHRMYFDVRHMDGHEGNAFYKCNYLFSTWDYFLKLIERSAEKKTDSLLRYSYTYY